MEKLATSSEIRQHHKSRRQRGHQSTSILSLPGISSTSLFSWSTTVKDAETGESLEIRPRHWEFSLSRPVDNDDKLRTEISTYVPRENQSNERIEGNAGEDSEWQSRCYQDGGEGSLLESHTSTTLERLWHVNNPENKEGVAADVDVDERGEYLKILDRVRDFGIGRPDGSIGDHTLLADEEKEHEPDTPRSTELLHSPVWVPVLRKYPLVDHAPNVPKQAAWRIPQGKKSCPSYKSGHVEGDCSGHDTAYPKQPDTPRPTELLHSPVWIPAPRKYPLVGHAPNVPKQKARRIPQEKEPCPSYKNGGYEESVNSEHDGGLPPSVVTAYRKQRMVTSFTSHLRSKNVQNVPRDGEPVKPSVTTPPSSVDVALPGSSSLRKVGNTPKDESIRKMTPAELAISGFDNETVLSDVVRDDVRHKIYRLQKTRDRYLRQILDMLVEEAREEHRREATLRNVATHSLRHKRLLLRHQREREERKAVITRIMRDAELIVVQKTAELGLVR